MTIVYLVVFFTGVIGNICTCVVISRNRYMHTATNFYLFSLAISDLLLLLLGLPTEFYELWFKYPYVFGESFCIVRGLCAETSANASILTITAFTVERYVAICHPIQAHTISRPSRAVKFIFAIWVMATSCAVPLALQFGLSYQSTVNGLKLWQTARCTVVLLLPRAFEISTFLFFCLPTGVILVLYVLIGIRLRQSSGNRRVSPSNSRSDQEWNGQVNNARHHGGNSRRSVIKMLGKYASYYSIFNWPGT
ncbi:NMUR1 (predicted) [Pycnogonum litorale]